jgi:hypothetical protein
MLLSDNEGGSVTGLSVTDGCRWRAVMELLCPSAQPRYGQYCSLSEFSRVKSASDVLLLSALRTQVEHRAESEVPNSEIGEPGFLRNHSATEGLANKLNSNAKGEEMQIAPQITFEGSDSSGAARAQILVEIERLETHNQRVTGCRVKVIAPSHKHRHGIGFQVHIWLTVPPHENVVVNHTGTDDARNEHARVAIKDAFAAARRQIDDLAA